MRPYTEVLHMWNQYDDRELLDWQEMLERVIHNHPGHPHVEHSLQDLKAIYQLLHKRKLL